MRDKNVAGILALFFGWAGIHRFYLGQVGLGILYAILLFTGVSAILGLIDAIVFFSMDQEVFDYKYNESAIRRRRRMDHRRRRYDTDFDREERRRRERRVDRYQGREKRRELNETRRTESRKYYKRPTPKPVKSNPYKNSGIKKYKDYDYDGAVEDFKKALEIDDKDIAVHFNIACAYSLNEEAEKAFYHLDKAVELGFNDFKRIKEHDALAFLRIQDEFETFESNGFRLEKTQQLESPKEDLLEQASQLSEEEKSIEEELQSADLLEQLKKLGELREKGLLTEEEFVVQKRKLLE